MLYWIFKIIFRNNEIRCIDMCSSWFTKSPCLWSSFPKENLPQACLLTLGYWLLCHVCSKYNSWPSIEVVSYDILHIYPLLVVVTAHIYFKPHFSIPIIFFPLLFVNFSFSVLTNASCRVTIVTHQCDFCFILSKALKEYHLHFQSWLVFCPIIIHPPNFLIIHNAVFQRIYLANSSTLY